MTTLFAIKKLEPDAKLPTRATPGSAGYDLYSYDDGMISPGCQVLVSTKIAMKIPDGYCGLIWPRSGLSVRHGIETGAGVIDSDYRKDVGVVLHNLSNTSFNYTKGMRIAQLLITPILTPNIVCEDTDEFDDTKRGGYGSTGTY
jgi:dUTP pyrophosphatase